MTNKPFKLIPVGKDYLWGGNKLKEEFNINLEMYPLAESWGCSVHPDGLSIVGTGEYAGKTLKSVLDNNPNFLGTRFENKELSILVKLIDAKEQLSVQVHPDDEYAKIYENGQKGKTEMWYVLDAEENAEIIYGLNNPVEKKDIEKSVACGDILKYMQRVKVSKGDVFFVEPGTIHAIGAGCVIAEIQENSNITYRLFDYNRVDNKGKQRELSIDKALEIANLDKAGHPRQPLRVLKYAKGMASEFLCRCKYFEVHRIIVNSTSGIEYRADELGYRILLCIDGKGIVCYDNEQMKYHKGDCIFVPADSSIIRIIGNSQFLDVRG